MTPQEKAKELFEQFISLNSNCTSVFMSKELARKCAKVAVENEFKGMRVLAFNLKELGTISQKDYENSLNSIIETEKEVLIEIQNL